MLLYRETKATVDISSAATVLTYTYSGMLPIVVIARVEVGSTLAIAGDGDYALDAKIDGVAIAPLSMVSIAAGITSGIMISRHIAIENGDVITILVTGLPADTAVDSVATLYDVTPAQVADLVGGGPTAVNHNYCGTDSLAYKTAAGIGIEGATVQAFLKTDYDADNRSQAYLKATTGTDVNGRFNRDLMLSAGTYTLVYFKQGAYGPNAVEITVT